jgi:hypothetical protein
LVEELDTNRLFKEVSCNFILISKEVFTDGNNCVRGGMGREKRASIILHAYMYQL